MLKKQRAVLRASITKAYAKIQNEDDVSSLSGTLELMRVRSEELTAKDQEVLTAMGKEEATEEDLVKEQEQMDKYLLMYYESKARVEEVIIRKSGHGESSVSSSNVAPVVHVDKSYRLPTLQLKKFDGTLGNWLPFWSQFEKIHVDQTMAKVDKVGYLTMCMIEGSPAEALVKSYPSTGDNYDSIVLALTNRFGRKDLLVEYYIRELLKIILKGHSERQPLSVLYDGLQCHLRNLETLDVNIENNASILFPLVSSCLPSSTLQIWERSVGGRGETEAVTSKEYLTSLLKFLKAEVDGAQKLTLVKEGLLECKKPALPRSPPQVKRTPRYGGLSTNNVSTASGLVNTHPTACIFCDENNHGVVECQKGKLMSLKERRNCIRDKKACFCCLRVGCRASHCKRRPNCSTCHRSHYDMMCEENQPKQPNSSGTNSLLVGTNQKTAKQCQVQMQTVVVEIPESSGHFKKARLLIDTGSQRSYVLASTMKELGYAPLRQEAVCHALFGGQTTGIKNHNVYKLHLFNLDRSYSCNFDVLDQDVICGQVSSVPDGPWIEELASQGVQLSDVGGETDIEILVGSDVAARLWTGKQVELASGLVAMETRLGWTLSGKIPNSVNIRTSLATIVTDLFVRDAPITDLWSLDVLGIRDPTDKVLQADVDKATKEHFLSTVRINSDGRFEIRLPFMNCHPPLSDNLDLVKRRLKSTLARLKRDGYTEEYRRALAGWEQSGIIEKVPPHSEKTPAFYLPHHHVVKVGSTTPIRPVFDASARELNKYSLNQCLESGPNLIEKIPSSLARFRSNKIGISGDIAKAFLQISVNEADRDFLRFLWMDEEGQLITYRHCRVVFGVSSSPFLLESCLNLHLEETLKLCIEGKVGWPLPIIEMLANSFYVDNCLVSVESESLAQEFIKVASSVMIERGFDLRGWELTGDSGDKPTNVLGLLWDKANDTLFLNIDRLTSMDFTSVTKRVILSAAHRLFDPIGFVSCVALIPKLLVQETWKQNLSWTEEVSEELKVKFLQWLSDVPLLREVRIPRWVCNGDSSDAEYEIHVFSDACKHSYASVIFLRVKKDENVSLGLLASRARVAPVSNSSKGMTIPRLELLAALIAARLYRTVINDYKLSNIKTIFWTDASTVLAWLERNEPWDVYVMNRVKEIRELTVGCEWRHISGTFNPADLPSRGCSIKKFVQSRWWEGPQWLKGSTDSWVKSEVSVDEEEVNSERKKLVVSSMVDTTLGTQKDWYYRNISDFKRLVRTFTWILRFKTNALSKGQRTRGEITVKEYALAESKILILVQKEAFSDISHPKLATLLPFVDQDGLIRLKTKVSNLPGCRDFSHPIVLPNADHPVVKKLVTYVHKLNCHAGTQILMSILRKQFWILGGRRTIRSVLKSCVQCKRYTAKNMETVPIPLPESRVRDCKVFEVTGVDLAGPLFIKGDDKNPRKVWVVLFTCAVYRAVRLELVSSLSTDSFLQAFRRFCGRNGRPLIVYSDNGTNFTGFDSACQKLDWNMISQFSTAQKIDWRFNVPSAPWWGGWWERIIGILKGLLRRVLGRSSVDYEEMSTLLCDCEAVINSRPLTYMSDSASDLAVLTPEMFLHELDEIGVPEYDHVNPADLRNRLKYRHELKRQLRERFKLEYLGQLQLVVGKKKEHTVKVGDIVLIGDDNCKRLNWPMGRVIEVIPGRDDHVRVVRVRTTHGVLTRPIQRLFPLESMCEGVVQIPVSEPVHEENPVTVDVPRVESNDIDVGHPTEVISPSVPLLVTRHGRNVKRPTKLDL